MAGKIVRWIIEREMLRMIAEAEWVEHEGGFAKTFINGVPYHRWEASAIYECEDGAAANPIAYGNDLWVPASRSKLYAFALASLTSAKEARDISKACKQSTPPQATKRRL